MTTLLLHLGIVFIGLIALMAAIVIGEWRFLIVALAVYLLTVERRLL